MSRVDEVTFEFVEEMPADLAVGTLYVSIPYRMSAHLCLCGCGEKVVNPLRPNRWSITFDGPTISLAPSVGNSGTACKSHYWITHNKVRWMPPMSEWQSEEAFRRDGWERGAPEETPAPVPGSHGATGLLDWFRWLLTWLRRRS